MLKLILTLVNITIFLKEAGACLPGPDNNNGPDRDCSGKPDFSPCNQPCRALWCSTPYTKCFFNKCKSYCYDQADGSPCGEGLGKCKNQSCQPDDVPPHPDKFCSGKPDFSPCFLFCKAVWCGSPYTKCFDNKCESYCLRKPDGSSCGKGKGSCKNQSCQPEVVPLPGTDCSGKPDFSPCNQLCRAPNCVSPYTKCFDNACKSYCYGQVDGSPCGGGRGKCKNQSCEPGYDCSGKPDFTPCNQFCRAGHCVFPYTKCFDNTCKSDCYDQPDGSPCGGGRGKCKNQSCQPGKPPGGDCTGKPNFASCERLCLAEFCKPPYTKCFDNKCESHCFGEKNGTPCGGHVGTCINGSCTPWLN